MATRLFVGNLPWSVTDDELEKMFSEIGDVESARVITDRMTGRSRGFGFVDMGSEEEAKKAMSELDGKEVEGRAIVVNEARPRTDRE